VGDHDVGMHRATGDPRLLRAVANGEPTEPDEVRWHRACSVNAAPSKGMREMDIRPFRIAVEQSVLDDLRATATADGIRAPLAPADDGGARVCAVRRARWRLGQHGDRTPRTQLLAIRRRHALDRRSVLARLSEAEGPSPAEGRFLEENERFQTTEGAYALIQGTRPRTLAHALDDSPAGLLAWIVEKFQRWSDCEGDVERRFTKDELLTNVMLYWVTGTIRTFFPAAPGFALTGLRSTFGPWPRTNKPRSSARC